LHPLAYEAAVVESIRVNSQFRFTGIPQRGKTCVNPQIPVGNRG
jgi:hypothetical protein